MTENPILDIRADCLTQPIRLDLAVIEVTMLWPDDIEARREALITSRVEELRPSADTLIRSELAELARQAADARPLRDIQKDYLRGDRLIRGSIAGTILRETLGRLEINHNASSMKQIVGELSDAFSKKYRLSVKTIANDVWPTFRPVAHFWAAHLDAALFFDETAFPCQMQHLSDFLARSEGYRMRGEIFRTKQSPTTVLHAAEMFRLPSHLMVEPLDPRFQPTSMQK